MEKHPRLDITNLKIQKERIILGSFPTWSLTLGTDDNDDVKSEKLELQNKFGDIPFFYGSSTNKFWNWYKTYLDNEINLNEIDSIKASLERNGIGITDVIISCQRKNRSALDKHLTERFYNHNFFNYPKTGERLKILCTSKGVMNDMLLTKKFLSNHKTLSIDQTLSDKFQFEFVSRLSGDSGLIKKPFYTILKVLNGGTIECLAIPSPGSPYRRLSDFGLNITLMDKYLESFIQNAFNWIKA
ncbi:MAG: hypothetical protein JWR05_212 [Mucilaginibacter sp.]|nr:hypothetical protein [Mucilaginibacter sp.]